MSLLSRSFLVVAGHPNRADLLAGLGLLSAWALSICFVNPAGDFPLNDDWSYARGVWNWVAEGELKLDTWPAMTLIGQTAWGALFSRLFGLSFVTLRWSTLVSAGLGMAAFYGLARRFTVVPPAFFATLLVFFNPLYFSLSFTFMTEVHFLTALLLGSLAFTRYLERGRWWQLALAVLFSILATLIRQPGLLLPLAFGFVLLFRGRRLRDWLVALLPFLSAFAALRIYFGWLAVRHPQLYKVGGAGDILAALAEKNATNFISQTVNLFLSCGLFLLPLVVVLLPGGAWRRPSRQVGAWLIAGTAAVFLFSHRHHFPVGNIFYNLGLGPKLLKDGYWMDNIHPSLPADTWGALAYFAILGTIGLILLLRWHGPVSPLRLWRPRGLDWRQAAKWGLAFFCLAYFLLINSISSFFDRYSLPLMVGVALLVLPTRWKGRLPFTFAGVLLLAVFACFSVAATHDYLSWNRARHAAYHRLRERGIPPGRIDGGFEINAWLRAGPFNPVDKRGKSWWPVNRDDYALAFGPIEGFTPEGGVAFPTWLPPGRDSLYILRRNLPPRLAYDDFPVRCDLEKLSPDGTHYLDESGKVEFDFGELRVDTNARSGQHAIELSPQHPYGLTSRFGDLVAGETFIASVWRYGSGENAGLVLATDRTNELYKTEVNAVVARDSAGWEQLRLTTTLPAALRDDQISIYLWNAGQAPVWFDDLLIQRLPPEEAAPASGAE